MASPALTPQAQDWAKNRDLWMVVLTLDYINGEPESQNELGRVPGPWHPLCVKMTTLDSAAHRGLLWLATQPPGTKWKRPPLG